jgi:hypothetical protein
MQQIKVYAGIKDPGTFRKYKSTLTTEGLLRQDGNKYFPTKEGEAYPGIESEYIPQDTQSVLAVWSQRLFDGARRMPKVLIDHNGEWIDPETAMQESNIVDPGTYRKYKSTLVSAELAITDGRMIAANKDTLFL